MPKMGELNFSVSNVTIGNRSRPLFYQFYLAFWVKVTMQGFAGLNTPIT